MSENTKIEKAGAERTQMGTEPAGPDASPEQGHSLDGISTDATFAGRAVEDGYGVHASGVFAAGGVGNLDDGAAVAGPNANQPQTWGFLGQASNQFDGNYPGGKNSSNPSGDVGGRLRYDQAQRFIDYVWNATVLANDGRKVTMRANTMEIEKVNVGERVIRAANQADDTYVNAGARFTKVELVTTKIRLDWELSTESLEDNIEGAAFEDHLVRLMTNAFGNDLEDLAINGDKGSNDAFTSIMDGFVKIVQQSIGAGAGGGTHEAKNPAGTGTPAPGTTGPAITQWKPEVLQGLILALPRKYRAIRTGMKFYCGTDTFANIVANNGTGPLSYDNNVATEAYRNNWLSGTDQTFGPARTTRVLGIPVLEVPFFKEDYVELSFPDNRVWGLQRDITVNREYRAKKDTIEYTVYIRFGINMEELDAVAWMDAATDAP
jgi:hypothetical protein